VDFVPHNAWTPMALPPMGNVAGEATLVHSHHLREPPHLSYMRSIMNPAKCRHVEILRLEVME
jgi:hypothetical protein